MASKPEVTQKRPTHDKEETIGGPDDVAPKPSASMKLKLRKATRDDSGAVGHGLDWN